VKDLVDVVVVVGCELCHKISCPPVNTEQFEDELLANPCKEYCCCCFIMPEDLIGCRVQQVTITSDDGELGRPRETCLVANEEKPETILASSFTVRHFHSSFVATV
jgi:hypothetical protein